MERRKNRERGYTLLEYCAGAAIIASILWTALNSLGGDLSALLGSVGGWANARQNQVVQ
jgi:type II secretory pathway pseudopilin PulG